MKNKKRASLTDCDVGTACLHHTSRSSVDDDNIVVKNANANTIIGVAAGRRLDTIDQAIDGALWEVIFKGYTSNKASSSEEGGKVLHFAAKV